MPLYLYECLDCKNVIEILQLSKDSCTLCKICGSSNCQKIIGNFENRVVLGAKDMYEQKIKPDVDRVVNKIHGGSDKDFLDICGEE